MEDAGREKPADDGGGDDGSGEGRHSPLVLDPTANLPEATLLEDDDRDDDDPTGDAEDQSDDGPDQGEGDFGDPEPGKSVDSEDEAVGEDDETDHPNPKRNTKTSRPPDELEAKHRDQLMRAYAAHCQVCLADREPDELAPADSYVAPFELRKKVIEGHHLKAYAAGGGRHGGNLLILCHLHHRNLGDDIAPVRFVEALRCAKPIVRTFRSDSQERSVEGHLVRIDTPEGERGFFFAPEHRRYWLERAGR